MALYRTYRPGRLADVIGQDHVTGPLARALDSGRAHHAYLFTGPRGCGKTSTARIVARSLNCAKGPTSEPCGVCQSCVDLAPNGPGSIDVVEMDAATHGLVEDARDLRDKVMYAPLASRYKIYILDEAHQLGPGAANALLKVIEEPPPHLWFVFATTEPDKILATIRSRTHQYPFRLVPTRRLQEHLAWVCQMEQVTADPAALALVARAGQGSVRDSLSVLGQLIAGSGEAGVTYADAVGQLGFTDVELLDQYVDALIAGDGRGLFAVVDRVIDAGLDPRRFATDLLERLRDMLVLAQVPEAAEAGLLDLPDTQVDTVRRQSDALGLAALSRAADLVCAALSELKGATAPRLQLELLGARLLLPGADDSDTGVLARLERVESTLGQLAAGASVAGAGAAAAGHAGERDAGARAARKAPDAGGGTPSPPVQSAAGSGARAARAATPTTGRSARPTSPPSGRPATAPPKRPAAAGPGPVPAVTGAAPAVDPAPGPGSAASAPAAAPGTAPTLAQLRSAWADVLRTLGESSKVAATLAAGTVPLSLDDDRTLVLGHPDQNHTMAALRQSTGHLGRLTTAVLDVTGAEVTIVLVPADRPAPVTAAEPGMAAESPASATGAPGDLLRHPEPADSPGPAGTPASSGAAPADSRASADSGPDDDEEAAAPDDPDVSDSGMSPLALVQRELGGSIVEEFDRPS
jgi:DNA polymerase-3 subunit gamma/tau